MAIWKPNKYLHEKNIYKQARNYLQIENEYFPIYTAYLNIYSYQSLLMTRMVLVPVTPATVPALFPAPLLAVRLPDLLTITYSWKHNTGVNEMLR